MLKFSNKPIISHLVFLFSITVTTLTIIPALFPSLYSSLHRESIITSVDQFDFNINPLEPGLFFIPIILTGILVLVISIIIKFKGIKLRSINLSKKYSYISIIVILSIFTILSYEDVTEPELHEDWNFVKESVMAWPTDIVLNDNHVKKFLLSSSFIIFGNYRVIPFLGSMALIVMTYLLTNKITDSRLAGVIASVIILQSNLFLSFSTTGAYSNFWVLFYIISLFMIVHKTWFLQPVPYVMSIFSKILSITFFPISIFFILNAEISIKKKIISLLSLGILISVGIIFVGEAGVKSAIDWNGFWNGFVSFSYQMRYDGLVVLFLIPIVTGLYFISKKNQYANSVSIMISSVLLTGPLLLALTDITTQPYRFIPLVVFCAIGIGMILANQKEKVRQVSKNSRKQ
jgi:hypothetical protein